jgi:hypothetical protein
LREATEAYLEAFPRVNLKSAKVTRFELAKD